MSINPDVATIVCDPRWFAHRYDPGHDTIKFIRLDRAGHARATFLDDDYLPADLPTLALRRVEALAAAPAPAPVHFILHSAFCCSTMLARAFDLPGIAMGLKEPRILQDLVGVRLGGADPNRVGMLLDQALRLLARPPQSGEAVVIKPSNILNSLGPAMLAIRPEARALLLHAPLRTFLGSVARKGMWGRLWARELIVGLAKEGYGERLGFSGEQLLGQTDLQVAGVGWLAQHVMFAEMVQRLGPARVRTLDSDLVTARPRETIAALAALYGLPIGAEAVTAIVAGPAFTHHSKSRERFGGAAREEERQAGEALHADEIDKATVWIEAVAAGIGLSLTLPAPLLG